MLFQKFSFGVYCVKWDCDLMKDIEVVESGNRQGCLIFHLAFVLTVGPLAIEIKNCKGIKAIRNWSAVNDVYMEAVVKIALYADHITLFLQNENEILLAVISLTVSGPSTICSLAVKLSQHGRSSRGALLLVNMKCIRKA